MYLCGMKLIIILRELNWGVQTFNEEINKLGLSLKFGTNSKISVEDYEFLKKLYVELKKEEMLLKELSEIRNGIKTLCIRDNQDPNRMGELEKRQLFFLLRNQPLESLLMPQVAEYTEENFWIVYNWNVEWNKKNFFEKRKVFDSFIGGFEQIEEITDIQINAITGFINYAEAGRLSKPSNRDSQKLIQWYKKWISLTRKEKDYEESIVDEDLEDQINGRQRLSNNDSVDEETAIMASLIHGDGDKFGFD